MINTLKHAGSLSFAQLTELNYHLKQSKSLTQAVKELVDSRESVELVALSEEEFCLKGINLILSHKHFERMVWPHSEELKLSSGERSKSALFFLNRLNNSLEKEIEQIARFTWEIVKCNPKTTLDLLEQHFDRDSLLQLYDYMVEEMQSAIKEIVEGGEIEPESMEAQWAQKIVPNILIMANELGGIVQEQEKIESPIDTWMIDYNKSLFSIFESILCPRRGIESTPTIVLDVTLEHEHLLLPEQFLLFYYKRARIEAQYQSPKNTFFSKVNDIKASVNYWLEHCSLDYLKNTKNALNDVSSSIRKKDIKQHRAWTNYLLMGEDVAGSLDKFNVLLTSKIERKELHQTISNAESVELPRPALKI